MKRVYTRLSVVFLAVALSLSLCAPACMAVEYTSTGTFWQSIAAKGSGFAQVVLGQLFFTGVCSVSSDAKHHANAISADPNSVGNYEAVCEYCDTHFFLTEAQLLAAYADYTTNINTTYGSSTFGSDGLLYWSPKFKEAKLNTSGKISIGLDASAPSIPDFQKWKLTFTPSSSFVGCLSGIYNGSGGSASFLNVRTYFEDVFPITGTYTRQPGTVFSGSYTVTAGSRHPILYSEGVGSSSYYAQGAKYENLFIETVVSSPSSTSEYITTFSINLSPCVYSILPASGLIDITTGDISTDTRTGSLAGNFGYYGDNGQLIAAENMTIVNETNNTYTNPQTGATSPVTNWTYDYSDRSYHLTLESGDIVNVTYGDENVTIKEGDTVYNIYYLTTGGGETPDPGPSPSPSPSPDPGPSPSPGPGGGDGNNSNNHDNQGSWFGNIVISIGDIFNNVFGGGTEGGDPGGEDPGGGIFGVIGSLFKKLGDLIGAIVDGIVDLVGTVILKLLDALIALVNGVVERLRVVLTEILKIFEVVPTLFDGFLGFMGAAFAFLPEELVMMMEFGIFATILVGLVLLFLKR